jgi:hypothetical protein
LTSGGSRNFYMGRPAVGQFIFGWATDRDGHETETSRSRESRLARDLSMVSFLVSRLGVQPERIGLESFRLGLDLSGLESKTDFYSNCLVVV